jgi:glycolate oxidase FAD binding subunit
MSLTESLQGILGRAGTGSLAALPGIPVAYVSSVEEARELLAMAVKDQVHFALMGKGSKLGWSALMREPKFMISTERLTGVIEFEPGDGVLTAYSGTSMGELEAITRPHGLSITPQVPRSSNATLGGVIAAGQSGVDRLANGPARGHVLGTRLIQLNGELTRSGGRLVKNVSGYDIHRLLTGSFGSLGLITEASLRLMPVPEEQLLLRQTASCAEELLDLVPQLLESELRPALLLVENSSNSQEWSLHLGFAGRKEHIQQEQARAQKILQTAEALQGTSAEKEQARLRDLEPSGVHGETLQLQVKRSQFRRALRDLLAALGDPPHAKQILHPGIASAHLELGDEQVSPNQLQALRQALAPSGASLQLRRRTPLLREYLPPIKDPVRAQLSERLRGTYDPMALLSSCPPLEPAK